MSPISLVRGFASTCFPPLRAAALSWLVMAVVSGMPAHAHAAASSGFPPLPSEEPAAMSSWQTTCVGRVLIDLPTDRPWTWSAQFDHAEVTRLPQPMTREQFWALVNDTRASYAAQKHEDAPSRLAYYEKLGDAAAAIVYYESAYSRWGPALERYVFLDDQHAYLLKYPLLPTPDEPPSPAMFKPYVDQYTPVLARIHPLRPGEFPTVPGLCFDGAYVTGETGPNTRTGIRVALTTGSDFGVAFSERLSPTTFLESGFEILRRDERRASHGLTFLLDPDGYKQFKVLRKQLRALGGMQGQEFITRTVLNQGHAFYRFLWFVKGEKQVPEAPTIGLSMTTPQEAMSAEHVPYPPLLPEPDLIAFWDRMLSRFKVLPHPLPAGQTLRAVN